MADDDNKATKDLETSMPADYQQPAFRGSVSTEEPPNAGLAKRVKAMAETYSPSGGAGMAPPGEPSMGGDMQSIYAAATRHAHFEDAMPVEEYMQHMKNSKGQTPSERYADAFSHVPDPQKWGFMQAGGKLATEALAGARQAADQGHWDTAATLMNAGYSHILDGHDVTAVPTDSKMMFHIKDPKGQAHTIGLDYNRFGDWIDQPENNNYHMIMQQPGNLVQALKAQETAPVGGARGGTEPTFAVQTPEALQRTNTGEAAEPRGVGDASIEQGPGLHGSARDKNVPLPSRPKGVSDPNQPQWESNPTMDQYGVVNQNMRPVPGQKVPMPIEYGDENGKPVPVDRNKMNVIKFGVSQPAFRQAAPDLSGMSTDEANRAIAQYNLEHASRTGAAAPYAPRDYQSLQEAMLASREKVAAGQNASREAVGQGHDTTKLLDAQIKNDMAQGKQANQIHAEAMRALISRYPDKLTGEQYQQLDDLVWKTMRENEKKYNAAAPGAQQAAGAQPQQPQPAPEQQAQRPQQHPIIITNAQGHRMVLQGNQWVPMNQ